MRESDSGASSAAEGIDDFARLATFFGLDDTVCRHVAEAKPTIERHLDAVLDRFYAAIAEQPHLREMFASEERIGAAKEKQKQHWARLFSGTFDSDYVASVRRIANVHVNLGLEPQWYLGGYSRIMADLHGILVREAPALKKTDDRARLIALIDAVDRAVMFDCSLTIAVYHAVQQAAYQERLDAMADRFDEAVGGVIETVTREIGNMTEISADIQTKMADTKAEAATASSASEETATNTSTVAGAAEELSASFDEINGQTTTAASTAEGAVATAHDASTKVDHLSEVSSTIRNVVALIKDISEQTNLLALNATIEAARAGDAGKGFAVVAGEVKNLASQTSKATDQITQQVDAMNEATGETVTAISDISNKIETMRDSLTAIASAVEEQNAATAEVTRSVGEASAGSAEVSRAIVAVDEAAAATQNRVQEFDAVTKSLSDNAETLREAAERFTAQIRNSERH